MRRFPKAQTLLAVRDVLLSSKWYAELLDLQLLSSTKKDTHNNTYNRLLRDGELVLQFHSWDDEQHPNLIDMNKGPVGHGVLIWFEVDDFAAVVERAANLKAEVVIEPHVNPAPNQHEIWLRDPDGYHVVLSSPAA